jgi:glucose/arabinose dehydrogenase
MSRHHCIVRRTVVAAIATVSLAITAAPSASGAPLNELRLTFAPVASGLNRPIDLAQRPGGGLYVAERAGRVRALDVAGRPVVLTIKGVSTNGERGLLGLAFSPSGNELYVAFTDRTGDLRLRAYAMNSATSTGAFRDLLTVEHRRYSNHNGGSLRVDRDGLVYLGTGDGGGGGDPLNRASNPASLSGKILRIDPTPGFGRQYQIPATNPFFGQPGVRDEIYALGLRNPWRISIDPATNDLWIGDVGQDRREEINVDRAVSNGAGVAVRTGGQHYGWPFREASTDYRGNGPAGLVEPIYDYPHGPNDANGCSVTGGAVVRAATGPLAPLDGAYVFADFCSGRVSALRQVNGAVTEVVDNATNVANLVSFLAVDDRLLAVSIGSGQIFEARLG